MSNEDAQVPGWGDDYVCHCGENIVTLRRKELGDAPRGLIAVDDHEIIVRYGFDCRCGCIPLIDIQEAE